MSFRFDDDNEFEEVDEHETDEESEDEDESDEDDADEDESDDDEAERLERIEKAFRAERAVVRASDNVGDLRAKRREYQVILANTANSVGRLRMNDLIELVDEQVTNLKAKRFAAGRP